MDIENWSAVARCAGTLWKVGKHSNKILPMAKNRGLEPNMRKSESDACGGLFGVADQKGNLDWEVHYVDGTVIRAHQHAAGGKKGAFA